MVASPAGTPIDGVKLSRHDKQINSPSIVVGRDGTIHVAFIEINSQEPYTPSVYYRSSSDGGHTWTPAKNLSESHPQWAVGRCSIAVDGSNRVYVVWRSAWKQYGAVSMNASSLNTTNNLVYRVLDGGSWSAGSIEIHPPASDANPLATNNGSASYFVSTDPNGKVHVIWNRNPYTLHPDLLLLNGAQMDPKIDLDEVMEPT